MAKTLEKTNKPKTMSQLREELRQAERLETYADLLRYCILCEFNRPGLLSDEGGALKSRKEYKKHTLRGLVWLENEALKEGEPSDLPNELKYKGKVLADMLAWSDGYDQADPELDSSADKVDSEYSDSRDSQSAFRWGAAL